MITTLAQATPAWFTTVLSTNRVLPHGAIAAVDQRVNACVTLTHNTLLTPVFAHRNSGATLRVLELTACFML